MTMTTTIEMCTIVVEPSDRARHRRRGARMWPRSLERISRAPTTSRPFRRWGHGWIYDFRPKNRQGINQSSVSTMVAIYTASQPYVGLTPSGGGAIHVSVFGRRDATRWERSPAISIGPLAISIFHNSISRFIKNILTKWHTLYISLPSIIYFLFFI